MRIVRPSEIWSNRILGWRCFIFGFGLFVPILVFLVICDLCRLEETAAMVLGVGFAAVFVLIAPLTALTVFRMQVSAFRRRMFAILWVSVGLLLVVHGIGFVGLVLPERHMTIYWLKVNAALLGVWFLISMIAWPVILHFKPFCIQNGETCPECGYCVRGVKSAICPECGTAFDHTQLGLSMQQFERLISGGTNPPTRWDAN